MKSKFSSIWRVSLALVLALSLSMVMAVPASAGVLAGVTATPDNDVAGATANYLIEFTTAASGNLTTVDMEFPADFDVSAAALGTISGIGDGTIDITGQVVTYTVDDPVIIDDGVDISIALGNIVNTETPADDYVVTITTKDDEATTIDGPTASATFEIVQGDAASLEIIADGDIIDAGDTATYTATMTNAYGVEFDITGETTFETPVAAGGAWTDNEYASEFIGVWTVTGTYGDLEDTATLTVEGLELDAPAYKTGDTVSVKVVNDDANSNTATKQTIPVKSKSDTDATEVTIALQETDVDTGIFTGTFTLVNVSPGAGQVLVSHGDTVTVTYYTPEPDYVDTAEVDDVAPEIDLESLTPADGEDTNDATPDISADYSDDGSDIDTDAVVITVAGVDVSDSEDTTINDASVTYTPTDNLTDGDVTVTLVIYDLAGNSDETSWTFTVDTAAPMISDFSPADGGYTSDNTPEISAVLDDLTSGIDETSIVMTVDDVDISENVTFTAATGVLTYTPTDNLTEGEIIVTINVSDLAGNAAEEASWTFTVDTDDMAIAIDEVDTPTNVATQAVSGTYTETNLDTIVVTVNDVEVDVTIDEEEGTWATTDNVTLTEGDNLIVATITDLAGNTDSAETTIVLDTEAPVVTVPAADPDTINTGIEREVTFSANVTDGDGTGIASVAVDLSSLGGEAEQAMTEGEEEGVYEYTWEDLTVEEAGEYVLYITATDVVGNSDNTTSITLTVITDLDDPVIESTTVEYPLGYESARVGDDVIITAVVTDNTTEIVSVTIDATGIGLTETETLDPVEGEENTYSTTLTVQAGTTAGAKTFTITATDLASNDATEDVTVTVVAELTAYNIELEEGWNLISLPLIPDDEDIATILTDIADNVSQVRTFLYEGGGLVEYYWMEGGLVGALNEMVDGQGYWIEMTVANTLVINGTESVVGQQIPPAYDVYEGWNLIGYKAVDAGAADAYLGSVADNTERMYGYNAAGEHYVTVLVNEDDLEPGQGYWLAVSADGTIYP